jgi:hypothetical protein
MFGFGNPLKKLKKQYEKIMKQAVDAQRNGDIKSYSELASKADVLLKKIEKLEKEKM